jgi:hypothetical protein
MKKSAMGHKIASREEWLVARTELLEAEKALTRRSDEFPNYLILTSPCWTNGSPRRAFPVVKTRNWFGLCKSDSWHALLTLLAGVRFL